MTRRTRGMTLIELLAAMALLGTLGTLLVQLMRNAFDLYHAGERNGQHLASAATALGLLENDLSNLHTGAGGRLVVQVTRGAGGLSMIRMTRSVPQGEMEHPVLRAAAVMTPPPPPQPDSKPTDANSQGLPDGGKPEVPWGGGDPGPGYRESLAPPSGLLEVCWALTQEEVDPPGMLTLWRGVRSPALAQGSYFGEDGPAGGDTDWIRKNLSPVITGVLFFRVFVGDSLPSIETELTLLDAAPNASGQETWDSTRAILPPESFGMARGASSLKDERDDIFPRRIGVTLTLGVPGQPDGKLVRSLRPGEREIVIDDPGRLPRLSHHDRLLLVGGEWCEVNDLLSGGGLVVRGRRRTSVGDHPPGTPVYIGRTFRLAVRPPPGRFDYTEATR